MKKIFDIEHDKDEEICEETLIELSDNRGEDEDDE